MYWVASNFFVKDEKRIIFLTKILLLVIFNVKKKGHNKKIFYKRHEIQIPKL